MLKVLLAVKVADAAVAAIGEGLVVVGDTGPVVGAVPLNLKFDGR